jgi:hypothetical protein
MNNFISCLPRKSANQNPFPFSNFQTRTMFLDATGDQIVSVFPLLRRMAVINFGTNAGLTGITLSSSLINQQPGDTVGVFVMLDRGEVLSAEGSFELFVSHLTLQNSTAGARQASSRSNAIAMGESSAYLLNSGQRLALYACSDNVLGN